MNALLQTHALTAFYGDFQALFGIDFEIHAGETVAIIGSNGAGKSTFLKSVTGLLKAPGDSVHFSGEPISGLAPGKIVAKGLAMVPEGRRLFPSLSVEENLMIGGHTNGISTRSTACFPYCTSAVIIQERHCPEGSSKWSPSVGR
jgi:branched-chain amino acid transport system ATP-binding protein